MSSKKAIETPTKSSPGAMLKRAREKSGVSLQHISEHTLIAVSKLVALEADDFKRVGGSAYVIGYARNAAEAMGADPKPLVDAFTKFLNDDAIKQAFTADATRPIPAPGMPKQLKRVIVGVGIALVLVILTLIYLLASGRNENAPEQPSIDITSSQDVLSSDSRLTSKDSSDEVIVDNELETVAVPEQSSEDVEFELTLEEQAVDAQDASVEAEIGENTQAMSPEDDDSYSSDEGSTDILDDLTANLELFFTDECWVQVTDASGKRLVAQVANGGDHIQISGLAPFDIMLGNARVTAIELNGESVTIVPRQGKRTLRLSVGG